MQRVWIVMTVLLILGLQIRQVELFHIGFYSNSCPHAELVIFKLVRLAVRRDPSLPAALLRLHYHDCFIGGCDASILLDGALGYPPPEKMAPPNINLRGFKVMDLIKRVIESICPSIVSCADILALAARDAVVLAGGPRWEVPTGRKDSLLSSAVLAAVSLPQPEFSAAEIKKNFLWHGLSEDEMITLLGSHTIGFTHCESIWDQLYKYNSTVKMNESYAAKLRLICPRQSWSARRKVPLDPVTPYKFDNMFYKNIEKGLGILASDQIIYDDKTFDQLSRNSTVWEQRYRDAMVHLGSLGVITELRGEVRKHCRRRN